MCLRLVVKVVVESILVRVSRISTAQFKPMPTIATTEGREIHIMIVRVLSSAVAESKVLCDWVFGGHTALSYIIFCSHRIGDGVCVSERYG